MQVQKINSKKDIEVILEQLAITSKTVLIKPNWVGAYNGGYTDARVIDLFLQALKGKKVIFIESYTFWRTDKKKDAKGDYFSSRYANLEKGIQHWDFFKKMDDWFLNFTGIGSILKKHKAEYLNITNQVWEKNVAHSNIIKELVLNKYSHVAIDDMYAYIPKKIYDFSGSNLISLAKAKIDSAYGASFSIKNLFGLIPDPTRYDKYHGGDKEDILTQSIIDVHKIYQSLFKVSFMVESIFEYGSMNWDTGLSTKLQGNKMLIAGNDGYKVDNKALEIYNATLHGPMNDLFDRYKTVFNT